MKNSYKYIIVLQILPICALIAKNWIVSGTGGDFVKIQDALNVAEAGDTIFVRSKTEPYYESFSFPRSGNDSEGHIVLMNYPDEKPIIDGTGVDIKSDWPEGLVRIIDKSYIKISGFEIRNIVVNDRNTFPAGIWVYGGLSNVEITGNIVHTIQQTASNAGAHGIAVYGTNSNTSIDNILIDGNEIYDCKLGWSESLVLNGNVENFIVSNNIVHDNNNIALDFIGHEGTCPDPSLDQARNGLVHSNIAYNIDSRGNQAYGDEASADGIYIDGGKDIIIERNLVYNCNIGIEIASEHGGKSTSGIIVRNNFIMNNIVIGIAIGGYDSKRGATENCKILNNTLYKNNSESFSWGAEFLQQFYCTNNTIANNIICSRNNIYLIDNSSNTGSENSYDNNLYFSEGSPKWIWRGKSYSNFDEYKNGASQETYSLFGDPLLNSPDLFNLSIKSDSPAIDKGKDFDETYVGEFDFNGDTRKVGSQIDIGATESQSITSNKELGYSLKNEFKIFKPYPNPFNSSTKISFRTLNSSFNEFLLSIYNDLGQEIYSKRFQTIPNTLYGVTWNAALCNSGVYYAVLSFGNIKTTEKLVFMK